MMLSFWLPAALLSILSGLAYHYSTKEQWGIIHKDYFKKAKFFVGMLLGIIPTVYLWSLNWQLVITGGILLAIVASYLYQESTKIFARALILGLFLMAFDWVVENVGAEMNFWFSHNSVFLVGEVPIEVMIAATTGGFAYALLMPRKWNTKYVMVSSTICAVGGALGENALQRIRLMNYSGGWLWSHAVIAYFLTWVMLNIIWYRFLLKPTLVYATESVTELNAELLQRSDE